MLALHHGTELVLREIGAAGSAGISWPQMLAIDRSEKLQRCEHTLSGVTRITCWIEVTENPSTIVSTNMSKVLVSFCIALDSKASLFDALK